MGKPRSKESEYVERQQAAANARKAMLEKFRAKTQNQAADQTAEPAAAPAKGTSAETKRAPQTEQASAPNPHDSGKAKSKPDAGAKKGKRS